MTNKVFIEQFDNGIAVKWYRVDEEMKVEADGEHLVINEEDERRKLGELLQDEIDYFMNARTTNNIKLTITYEKNGMG